MRTLPIPSRPLAVPTVDMAPPEPARWRVVVDVERPHRTERRTVVVAAGSRVEARRAGRALAALPYLSRSRPSAVVADVVGCVPIE